jgi:hypothetical protein
MNPAHAAKQAAHVEKQKALLQQQQEAFERYVRERTPRIAATLVSHGTPWVLVHRMAQDKAIEAWFAAHPCHAKHQAVWEQRVLTHAVLSEMPG